MTYIYITALLIFGALALFSFLVFAATLGLLEFVKQNIAPLSAMAAAYLAVKFLGL